MQADRRHSVRGEENGYVYISFTGDEPETFGYIIDTLVSVNYQGMTFVK